MSWIFCNEHARKEKTMTIIKISEEALTSVTIMAEKSHTDKGGNKASAKAEYDMIVLCHLRWDFVFQRPQQLITRLSQSFNILFVEEPVHYSKGQKYNCHIRQVSDTITVLQPCVDNMEEIGPL